MPRRLSGCLSPSLSLGEGSLGLGFHPQGKDTYTMSGTIGTKCTPTVLAERKVRQEHAEGHRARSREMWGPQGLTPCNLALVDPFHSGRKGQPRGLQGSWQGEEVPVYRKKERKNQIPHQ